MTKGEVEILGALATTKFVFFLFSQKKDGQLSLLVYQRIYRNRKSLVEFAYVELGVYSGVGAIQIDNDVIWILSYARLNNEAEF